MKRKSVVLQYTSKHAIIYLLFKTCLGYQIHVKSIINSTRTHIMGAVPAIGCTAVIRC